MCYMAERAARPQVCELDDQKRQVWQVLDRLAGERRFEFEKLAGVFAENPARFFGFGELWREWRGDSSIEGLDEKIHLIQSDVDIIKTRIQGEGVKIYPVPKRGVVAHVEAGKNTWLEVERDVKEWKWPRESKGLVPLWRSMRVLDKRFLYLRGLNETQEMIMERLAGVGLGQVVEYEELLKLMGKWTGYEPANGEMVGLRMEVRAIKKQIKNLGLNYWLRSQNGVGYFLEERCEN